MEQGEQGDKRVSTLEQDFAEHRAELRTLHNAVKELRDAVGELRRYISASSRTPWLVIFGGITLLGGFTAWNLNIVREGIVSHVEENAIAARLNDDAIRAMQANRWTDEDQRAHEQRQQDNFNALHEELRLHSLEPAHSGATAMLEGILGRLDRMERLWDTQHAATR